MRILHGKIDIKRRPEDQTQFVYAFKTAKDENKTGSETD